MDSGKILVQLDSDKQPSLFDSVVAIDSGVDHLLRYGHVLPSEVQSIVHGAIFTRKHDDLHRTAIFLGGSDVARGEELLEKIKSHFLGGLRVSVLLDANGANTTAAAAVLAAASEGSLDGKKALVLGGTGPVGRRVVRLLARQGAHVRVGSRNASRSWEVCAAIAAKVPNATLSAYTTETPRERREALKGVQILVAAGAAGAELLSATERRGCSTLEVAIDLNAVPPLGLEGLEVIDRGVKRDNAVCYGAIGIGARKMKIHRAAIQRLFTRNDLILDAEQIFDIGREMP